MNKTDEPIDIKNLSAEDRKALKAQLAQEDKAEKEERRANVQALKDMGLEFLNTNIDSLALAQSEMETNVASIFKNMSSYIDLKAKIYGLDKLDQDSHTITHPDGNCSITIGYNAGISFDGTETAGVQKIMDYITALSGNEEDENAMKLAKAVKFFLKPNLKTGMLNPGRIIQLNQMRKDFNSPEFDEGMDIIIDAQNKTKGSTYVSGWKHVDIGDNRTRKLEFRFTV
ncbi:DUF3164 family protein [Flavobacterium sp. N1994]|uniref:DUF3164 family protein n=1 Tax=Flavobacterium sp. N1994 TaxID=2986827 RepID=UPI0022215B89|nr:DUF3164 family protein [Flavobacterium sp. N1994]